MRTAHIEINKPLIAYFIGKFKNLIPISEINKISQAKSVNDVLKIKWAVNTDWIANPEIKAKVKNSSPTPKIFETSL